jgi:sulfhydrogenase subunit alpha
MASPPQTQDRGIGMEIDVNVDVHHVTRVEGHGDIRVRIRNGAVEEARWLVVETPRYFEVMLKGKHYTSAVMLAARICGICSIAHCLASLRATERAFGMTIPEAASKLRLLAKHGETLQSHVLHLLFLVAPDFLNVPSVVPLLKTNPDTVRLAARLKGLGNRLCELVAGRATHPVALQVGGVSRMPAKAALLGLRDELARSTEDLAIAVELVQSFPVPDFVRETEFVSLHGEGRYPWIGGSLLSSDGVRHQEDEYRAMTNEYVVPDQTSKWCRLSRESFAVGALARFNNNGRHLHPAASEVADRFSLVAPCHNPFMNNVAQLVECVHCVHESIQLIEELVELGPCETMAPVAACSGEGVGAVEAPRGILYHHYQYEDGRIVEADCVIPTTQNNANIHHDLEALAMQFSLEGRTDERLEELCSMLVRAYDPCLSCSVH